MIKDIKKILLPYFARFFYYRQYVSIKKQIENCFKTSHKVFCFFPAYHTGGAEKVHTQILNALQPEPVACFITHKSRNNALKTYFIKSSNTFIDFNATGNYPIFRKKLIKLLAHHLNKIQYPITVFGSNSIIFYELLQEIRNTNIKRIDLLHAFSPYTNGIEKVSINYVNLLDTRIVINKRTLDDYKVQYEKNKINPDLIYRIVIIRNALDEDCKSLNKTFEFPLCCLFIGRNSPEKRYHIFESIAIKSKANNLPFNFSVVGDFVESNCKNSTPVILLGEIINKNELDKIYKSHHFLITTSIYEGFPLTIMEAMCNGLVNISTDVGGISEHISSENGILINNLSDEEIVQSFIKALQNLYKDSNKLKELSINSINYAQGHFNYESFKKSYRNILLKNS